jgi:hypothetical protein
MPLDMYVCGYLSSPGLWVDRAGELVLEASEWWPEGAAQSPNRRAMTATGSLFIDRISVRRARRVWERRDVLCDDGSPTHCASLFCVHLSVVCHRVHGVLLLTRSES